MILKDIISSPSRYGIAQGWIDFLNEQASQDYFIDLDRFVTREYENSVIYPPKEDIFRVFPLAPSRVKCVICGQDPYHGPGQAMGLAFSVREGTKPPPSLKNIMTELESDLGCTCSQDLTGWLKEGVFLINTTLTVRSGEPLSHQKKGWETFTKAAVEYITENKKGPLAAILWGSKAQEFSYMFSSTDDRKRMAVMTAHPSPLSAYRGFFGSKPFSRVNNFFIENGEEPIRWGEEIVSFYK